MEDKIVVRDFAKSYGKTKAVDHITFAIKSGTITGFVGKNGAGKTTTIHAIMNIIEPDNGSISVCGMDSCKRSKDIRKLLGYMPGDCTFYKRVKVIDILKLCSDISFVPLDKYLELAEYFELDVQKKPSELSLGNKKKLSIVQAFAGEKQIFILDEATSGLDPLMQKRFFDLLLKYKKQGKTIFMSSHNLADVEKYCDRALIIKDGIIVEDIDLIQRRDNLAHIVHYVTKNGEEKTLSFSGDLDALIQQLSREELAALDIRQASVEDEFINYFGGRQE